MVTGAVISAAGHRSSLSEFQPMVQVGDTTAIRRIIITLQQAGIDLIVVVTGDRGEELEKHISKMRVICLRNSQYVHSAMFSSICMGVNYLEDLCDRVLVMPTKAPTFLAESVAMLLGSKSEAACPVFGGRRGHPVLLSRSLIPSMEAFDGKDGLRGFLRQEEIAGLVEEIPVKDQGIIMALETDEDCKKAMEAGGCNKLPIHEKIQVYLERDEVFFGPGIAQFLTLVDHTGSMQTACRQMHMSYTKGWKIIKTAEKQLGLPLLITQSGGADGGCSELTPKARSLLTRFLAMEEELKQEAKRLFVKYFEEKANE